VALGRGGGVGGTGAKWRGGGAAPGVEVGGSPAVGVYVGVRLGVAEGVRVAVRVFVGGAVSVGSGVCVGVGDGVGAAAIRAAAAISAPAVLAVLAARDPFLILRAVVGVGRPPLDVWSPATGSCRIGDSPMRLP
jgi:hypothetical protein